MHRRSFLKSMAACTQFVAPANRPYSGTMEIGNRKELFVDDVLIEESVNISKVMTRPEKFIENPVVKTDRPWEPQQGEKGGHGVGIAGKAVLYDEDEKLFKMWYLCSGPPERSFWCYAVSSDGYNWQKPELGIFEYRGSKKNNILGIYGDPQYFNFFKDPNETDLRKRYKAMGEWENSPVANTSGGAYVGYSADGLRWTPYDGNPVIHHGPNLGDAPTMLGWDPLRKKYVCYPRLGHPMAPEIRGVGFHRHIRSLGYSEGDDFVHWTPTVPMLMPGREDRVDFQYEFLLVAITGQFYIGLVPMRQTFDRSFEMFLLSSRDGFHWNWIDHHRPFLERGEVGSYDGGLGGCSAPVFYNQQVWIYFNGTRYKYRPSPNSRPGVHDLTAISLATLPADRFMALIAGMHLGSLMTRPLFFSGSRLMLDMEGSVPVDFDRALAPAAANNRSFDDAEVRVALLDQSGGPIEGFSLDRCEPLFRSGFQEVKWTGQSVARLTGQQVRLRFELRNAGLYAFQFQG